MARVALVVHPSRPEAAKLAAEAVQWLTERGHSAVLSPTDAAGAGLVEVELAPEAELVDRADLAMSLGGDGTMLRTVDLACRAGVPVLGVNLGQLGYLSAVEPARVTEALERFVAGDYSIEERFTLEVHVGTGGGRRRLSAVNEAVLEKTVPGHTVRLGVAIAGEHFITYAADGLIVATPTGSTAYNLSARGPILSPQLRAVLVTPVSPHMLFDRSLVLAEGETVRVEVLEPRPAILVVDGTDAGVLEPGDAIECTTGPCPARFVTFGGRPGFHAILKAKFGLSDR
ncbi:MAG TPA: NAD(+)/NADH kinase [Acidimicrobiales bacterium]|nr:NAD(+)/NADH kinase [Acidimicrobiales bacterium]